MKEFPQNRGIISFNLTGLMNRFKIKGAKVIPQTAFVNKNCNYFSFLCNDAFSYHQNRNEH